jgi:hypothetical protein
MGEAVSGRARSFQEVRRRLCEQSTFFPGKRFPTTLLFILTHTSSFAEGIYAGALLTAFMLPCASCPPPLAVHHLPHVARVGGDRS